jgi:hypothetical protein
MSTASLFKEVEKLPYTSLNALMSRVVAARARKQPRLTPARERALLEKITAGAPPALLDECRRLMESRRKSSLTPAARARLVNVADELEAFNVRWLGWVQRLASLRGVSAAALLESLELPVRPYV